MARYCRLALEGATYGALPTTPLWRWVDIVSHGIAPIDQSLVHEGIARREARVHAGGRYRIEGDLRLNAGPDDIGELLKCALGNVTSVQEGATAAYKHTFTPKTDGLPSAQIEIGYDELTALRYIGSMVNSLDIAWTIGEFVGVTAGVAAQKDTKQTLATVTAPSAVPPFTFAQGTITIAGSANALMRSMTIRLSNDLDLDGAHGPGSRFFVRRPKAQALTVDVEAELLFESISELERFWGGTEPGSAPSEAEIILKLEGAIIESTYKYEFTSTLPRCIYRVSELPVDRRAPIVQRLRGMALYKEVAPVKDIIEVLLRNKTTAY